MPGSNKKVPIKIITLIIEGNFEFYEEYLNYKIG